MFGFFIEKANSIQQPENPIIQNLIKRKNSKLTHKVHSTPIQLPIPRSLSDYWRYSGGLTTPGCNGVVRWTLFEETVKINVEQAREISAWGAGVLSKNNREIQELNGRVVFRFGSNDFFGPKIGDRHLGVSVFYAIFVLLFFVGVFVFVRVWTAEPIVIDGTGIHFSDTALLKEHPHLN